MVTMLPAAGSRALIASIHIENTAGPWLGQSGHGEISGDNQEGVKVPNNGVPVSQATHG